MRDNFNLKKYISEGRIYKSFDKRSLNESIEDNFNYIKIEYGDYYNNPQKGWLGLFSTLSSNLNDIDQEISKIRQINAQFGDFMAVVRDVDVSEPKLVDLYVNSRNTDAVAFGFTMFWFPKSGWIKSKDKVNANDWINKAVQIDSYRESFEKMGWEFDYFKEYKQWGIDVETSFRFDDNDGGYEDEDKGENSFGDLSNLDTDYLDLNDESIYRE